ncbi:chromate efflux transporter [Rhizobium rosettiformans]|uniref:chromate efflux transporter n=1 Tax=Rhizobium rosettiformans TaxID=1368430 RepID=UPI0028594C6F|nr:chromate efflux transporter [Rhizobium rosettiformans]MDR7028759.1 chromate transporter [Rhizobium rosettiformans]MDR7063959.1 chromate transporter [Rhizobium rosettiformans]
MPAKKTDIHDTQVLTDRPASPTFSELTSAFARIGVLSFGGPAAQIALMHKICVEEKRWIDEDRYLHALNYCMLLPGPEAQQLATYIGWLLHGVRGGIVAGLLFVLPGLAVILGLSALYALYQETSLVTGLFFGLKAAVLAIVVEAVIRIGKRALKTAFHRGLAAAAFFALFLFSVPFPLVVLAAALIGLLHARGGETSTAEISQQVGARPPFASQVATLLFWIAVWLAPLPLLWLALPETALPEVQSFFSKMALVTFGGAYAVLAYVAQVAVDHYAWLKPGEMLDGLALAETTPGPLVLVLSYVGFLAGFRESGALDPLIGGLLGGVIAAWATFIPSFIWIFAGAPYVERLRGNCLLSAALSAITAAVVGVILNLAVWFALHVVFTQVEPVGLAQLGPLTLTVPQPVWSSLDWQALVIAVISAVLIFRFHIGIGKTLLAAGALGLAARFLL